MKLTPWFPGIVKPVRDGVYMRKLSKVGPLYYSLFIDGKWRIGVMAGTRNCRRNATLSGNKSAIQSAKWCGIEKP